MSYNRVVVYYTVKAKNEGKDRIFHLIVKEDKQVPRGSRVCGAIVREQDGSISKALMPPAGLTKGQQANWETIQELAVDFLKL